MTSSKELLIKVETLQNLLVDRATGGTINDEEYVSLRRLLVMDPRVRHHLPRFVHTCHSTSQFWSFIQPKFQSYKERREYLWSEFAPLLQDLEDPSSTPTDAMRSTSAQKHDTDGVRREPMTTPVRRVNNLDGSDFGERSQPKKAAKYKFDVAISFAGPQRLLAEALATKLRHAGIEVFYDGFYQDQLWGKDLADHFEAVYRKDSRYCVIFVSREYLDRIWTTHERRHAIARLMEQKGERYILPIRVDPVDLPGVPPTICYLDVNQYPIERIVEILIDLIKSSELQP
jgi:hypothetical protein